MESKESVKSLEYVPESALIMLEASRENEGRDYDESFLAGFVY